MKKLLFLFLSVLVFAFIAQAQNKKIESIYTDLAADKCKTLELDEGGAGFYRGECKGVGNYKLEVIEGDIRQTINVVAPNGKKSELDFLRNVSIAFSEVGEKAEWRVTKNGKKVTPQALIIRYNTNEDSETVTSRLVVIKVVKDSACITNIVEPSKDANVKARKLADNSASKPCIGTEQAQNNKIESIYTDLAADKCKTIESSAEGTGSYIGECPGVGGYKLEVLEGDIRQSINVVAPNGKKSELNFWSNVSGAFSAVGEKAEWRVTKNGKKVTPQALIIRYNTNEDSENTEKITSRLVVIKIINDTACITDIVEPVKDANVKARELADASAKKPCMEVE